MSQRETDLAWAAGIVEGEGHAGFYLYHAVLHKDGYWRKPRGSLQVAVDQSDPAQDMLYALQSVLGCGLVRTPSTDKWYESRVKSGHKHRRPYRWRAHGADGAATIRLLLPYMRTAYKREQFKQALEAWEAYQ